MSRSELLGILIAQSEEIDRLKRQIEEIEINTERRNMTIQKAGSIAKAALELNGVFEAAEKAAEEYLAEVRDRIELREAASKRIEAESRRKAEQLMEYTVKKCRIMHEETRQKCEHMIVETKKKAEQYHKREPADTREPQLLYGTQGERPE